MRTRDWWNGVFVGFFFGAAACSLVTVGAQWITQTAHAEVDWSQWPVRPQGGVDTYNEWRQRRQELLLNQFLQKEIDRLDNMPDASDGC